MEAHAAEEKSPALQARAETRLSARPKWPEEGSKEELKALAKALLEFAPIRRLIDLGKPSARFRRLLDRSLPSWLKFHGVFPSFADARANLPGGAMVGYDHEEITGIYKSQAVLEGDYPILLWLRDILPTASSVFDLGGNLGISFYAFESYVPYPEDIAWTVCDVPAVVRAGEKLAGERGERRLHFTGQFQDAADCDVLLTSGCLMYVEQPLAEMLRGLPRLPRHLLINRTAIHPSRGCVTLQNIRWMISPYHILERTEFIQDIEALGYTLIDEWLDATHSCWIPFYPEHSVPAYSGFYFKRRS